MTCAPTPPPVLPSQSQLESDISIFCRSPEDSSVWSGWRLKAETALRAISLPSSGWNRSLAPWPLSGHKRSCGLQKSTEYGFSNLKSETQKDNVETCSRIEVPPSSCPHLPHVGDP